MEPSPADTTDAGTQPGPYIDFDRDTWKHLRASVPQVLTRDEVLKLRGIGDAIDIDEVDDVYLTLTRLIHLRIKAHRRLTKATSVFLGKPIPKIPFIIGIAGSVAVGKSTTARLLQVLLSRWDSHPQVDLVTTDGFLYPTATLAARGLLDRKGFPESYEQRELLGFVSDVKAGIPAKAPVYSHVLYDRVPGEFVTVDQPDILILEGLNVLQTGPTLMVSDLFDFSIYVDARTDHIEQWFIDRFMHLKDTTFTRPESHFSEFAGISDARAEKLAREVWQSVNLPNLVENILPTRPRASLVLDKGENHLVQRVRMRKL
ncbi:type I pantothenate kinase [Corynebacterium mendelii]|uniref:Pantothenate kinase n=1 Tax=Corynebacterium mendelii TaxID=2765362 RepID=A0A939E3J7_9CORY|nr:type I pantothenate kinase [Corynebacterium mendelii]MBN9644792.1 type I pantothenate kinase [Corynebacterium mendelii]